MENPHPSGEGGSKTPNLIPDFNSWVSLGRELSDHYAESLEDQRCEQSLVQSLSQIEARACVLQRKKICLNAWLSFMYSGKLDRTERLEAIDFVPEYCWNFRAADGETYFDFIRKLVTDSRFLSVLAHHHKNSTVHYTLSDTIAYFLFQTASSKVSMQLICSIFSPLLEQELSLETDDVRSYLAKGDPRDDLAPVPFARAIMHKVLQEALSTHVFVEQLCQLLEYAAMDEDVDFSKDHDNSISLRFLEQLSIVVLSSLKAHCLSGVVQILSMYALNLSRRWPDQPRQNMTLMVWYLIFRDQMLVFLQSPVASGIFRHAFNSPFAVANFSFLTRLLESFDFGSSNVNHKRLRKICDDVCDILEQLFPSFETSNSDCLTSVFDPSICLHTREIRGMHLVFAGACKTTTNSAQEASDVSHFANLPGLETKSHSFLLLPVRGSKPRTFQPSICKIVETGKATGDLMDEKVSDHLVANVLPQLIACLTQIFSNLDSTPNLSNYGDISSLLSFAQDSISTRLGSTLTRNISKYALLCTRIEALRITMASLAVDQMFQLYSLADSWLKESRQKYRSEVSRRKSDLVSFVREFEDRCDVLEEDCVWMKRRLFSVKMYSILTDCKMKFSTKITLPSSLSYTSGVKNARKAANSKNQVQTFNLEASQIQEFCARYQSFIFGEALSEAEEVEPGVGLRIASDVLFEFSDKVVDTIKEDRELSEMIQGEIDWNDARDSIEEFLTRKLYSALTFVIISVRISEAILPDKSRALDFVHDEVFLARLRNLSWIQPHHLDFNIGKHRLELLGDEMLYRRASYELKRLDSWQCKTPREKMECLTRSIKIMTQGLCFELQTAYPDADAAFPALVIMIIRIAPQNLPSNLQFINHFRNQSKLDVSEHAYCFSQFSLAQSFIMSLKREMLVNVSLEEWEARMRE